MLHATHLITYGHFWLLYINNVKKICWQKTKGIALMMVSNPFINKSVYITKSQFLCISKMLKMKLSLKLGKIMRNCLRNSTVSFWNHNENYNASDKIVNENVLSQLFLNIDNNKADQEVTGLTFIYLRYQCTKQREIINHDRTIGTDRIKFTFQKFCQKRRVDLEKRLITPNLVVIRQWFYK